MSNRTADRDVHFLHTANGLIQLAVYPDGRLAIWDTDNKWWTPLNIRLPQAQSWAAP